MNISHKTSVISFAIIIPFIFTMLALAIPIISMGSTMSAPIIGFISAAFIMTGIILGIGKNPRHPDCAFNDVFSVLGILMAIVVFAIAAQIYGNSFGS